MFTSTGCRNADNKDTAPLNRLYETNTALSTPCTLSMHVFAISHHGCGWRVCVPIPGQKLEHLGPLQLPRSSTSTLYLNANLKKQCFMTFLIHYNYFLDLHIHKYKLHHTEKHIFLSHITNVGFFGIVLVSCIAIKNMVISPVIRLGPLPIHYIVIDKLPTDGLL